MNNRTQEARKGVRLQKVLAELGLASRREAEHWIAAGRVTVNRRPAELGTRVLADDDLALDGKRLPRRRKDGTGQQTLLYNKPAGEICTRRDPEGRPTVFDRLPKLPNRRWISVGRLDFNTSGLLLLTTDGELASRLMHPRHALEREYAVRVHSRVDEEMLRRLREGVQLEDGEAKFTDIQPGRRRNGGDDQPHPLRHQASNEWFYVVLMEGRNREVRRLWESQGVQVSRLKRVRFAHLLIPSRVSAGRWTEVTGQDLKRLYEQVSLPMPPRLKPGRRRS